MAKIIYLPTNSDDRGSLTVLERILPFEIKRAYFIYKCDGSKRGFHSHKKTQQALVAVNGSCDVHVLNSGIDEVFTLDSPEKCLLLAPSDYHWMDNFNDKCVLTVFASEFYNKNDYINGI